ncbi:erythromycin esterase family protein [Planococcus lenghuensis]|uniref:Protein-L-isoaspartate O-methyltransferase n=1 Tax=Planococcus lenghuensis TaxID=2213202 RepID=A0A1Q2KV08_9BACL|nr:erythromycin esterase family protein [Planococcus lenghuensis]AQQ51954.1 protein-L-isoaspartate O-methyltransferase [Planococcus lenghuensis]
MEQSLTKAINTFSIPYQKTDDLTPLMNAIGEAKIVMLGEASHGTSEFYSVRAELTKRLIQERGFSLVAVEGDWPAAREANRYVKGHGKAHTAREALQAFGRWPTWMWANEEIVEFLEWMKDHNNQSALKTGFYGIDVYSLWESMDEVIQYLTHTDPSGGDLELAKKAFTCFEPYNRIPENYALSSVNFTDACVEEVSTLLSSIRSNEERYKDEQESDLNLEINALVAKNAEDYYRAMVHSNAESWNIRDEHMVETVNEIMDHHGPDAKIVIWEHNTHIGDARATDMAKAGMINVGQRLREQNRPEEVYAVGFGTHRGTVIAADEWAAPQEVMQVPPARARSWEDELYKAGGGSKYLLFDDKNRNLFNDWIGHRAIGVVYNPAYEAYGNYVPTRVSERYDAFVYIEETKALSPLPQKPVL